VSAADQLFTEGKFAELFEHAERLERKNAVLRDALASQVGYWEQVPSGVDYEADEEDTSPEDAVAHTAGLAIRAASAALAAGGAK
jgi:hypothetical protein